MRPMKSQGGFTMTELVLVIVIVGIMSAFAVQRFSSRNLYDARAFADQTAGMIRYAQKLAIAQNRPVYVRMNGSSVALCFQSSCDTSNAYALVQVPASGSNSGSSNTKNACSNLSSWECEAPPDGVSYSVSPALSSSMLYFDSFGKPYSGNADLPKTTITITGADNTRSFTIETETGYVH